MSDRGWFKCPSGAWPILVAPHVGGEEWAEEMVAADLSWWLDQRDHYGKKVPGYRSMMRRWGWTQHRTRRAMREALGAPDAVATHRRRTGDAVVTQPERLKVEKREETDAPTTHRRRSSDAPISTRAYGSQTQTSDTDTDTDKIPDAAQPALPVELPEAPVSASGEGDGSREPDPDSTASRVAQVAAEWWRLWEIRRARHPRGAPRSPDLRKVDRQAIKAVVAGKKPKITVSEAITICRWMFYGDDQHARFLRGEREDGQVENEHLTPSAAYKPTKLGEKLTKAQIFLEEHERKRARAARVEADRVPAPTIPDRPTAAPPHIRERMRQRREAKIQAEIEKYGFSMEQL